MQEDEKNTITEEPNERKSRISDDELFKLSELGITPKEIVDYYNKKGISVNLRTIYRRCMKIYKSIGKEPPNYTKFKFNDSIDEKIIMLKFGGASYREIEKYLKEIGVNISYEAIRNRIKKIDSKSDDKDKIKKAIVNLKKSKNATDEQLKIMAELYGVDLEIADEKEL